MVAWLFAVTNGSPSRSKYELLIASDDHYDDDYEDDYYEDDYYEDDYYEDDHHLSHGPSHQGTKDYLLILQVLNIIMRQHCFTFYLVQFFAFYIYLLNLCPRSIDPFYIVGYYIKGSLLLWQTVSPAYKK